MWQTWTVALFLVLHLLLCVSVTAGILGGVLKVNREMLPFVVLVPFWGALTVLILHLQIFTGHGDVKRVGVEKMRVNEEIYRSIFVENEDSGKGIVPLEEALIINEPGLRREMIMDVLNDDPQEYVEFLQQARMNEDVEVVHYATTAMAELSKEYDFRLQKLEKAYGDHPEDEKTLAEYCEFLGEYIERGMVQGQMQMVQRHQYSQLLKRRLECREDIRDYEKLAKNELALKEYAQARETIDRMGARWPGREEYWMLRLQYFASQKRGQELEQVIGEMERNHIYLSHRNNEILEFWQQTQERDETD